MSQAIDRIYNISSKSVERGTKKNWDEWISILNSSGAGTWPHREITSFLKKKFRLNPWWLQWVAIGYEIHIGRRIEGQNLKGVYSTTVTKTVPASADQIWRWMVSAEGVASWLGPMDILVIKPKNCFEIEGGTFGEVRTVAVRKRIRMSWNDPDWMKISYVQIQIVRRSKAKSLIAIQHEGLPTALSKRQMSTHWRARIDETAIRCSTAKE